MKDLSGMHGRKRCEKSGGRGDRMRRILLTAVLFFFFFSAGCGVLLHSGTSFFACDAVYAGAEADGSDAVMTPLPQIPEGDAAGYEPVTVSCGTDADGTELTASERRMKPGETYDISEYKDPTWLVAFQSGTYRVKGQSEKTMLLIHAKAADDIRIVFGDENEGVRMVATKKCPGADANARSPIRIEGEAGGKVTLVSAAGQTCYFRAKGGVSAIRKDTPDVRLTFDTEDPDEPGTFEVHADKTAVRTSAIGCYSNVKTHHTFGNTVFQAGRIQAYGSEGGWFGGGPGIGADMFGQVKGITFENAEVEAYAGSGSSASIGTASADVLFIASGDDGKESDPDTGGIIGDEPDPFSNGDRFVGIACRNITINGGAVKALHRTNISERQSGGAGIGGGWGAHSDSIVINGGKVKAEGTKSAAGIGGGNEGNCNGYSSDHKPKGYGGGDHGVIINGGEIDAEGGAAGIGSGYAEEMTMEMDKFRFGDCRVVIRGGKVAAEATDNGGTAIGGYKSEKYDPVMSIEISGGEVSATGPDYGTGIGCGSFGDLQQLKISGGIIHARTGKGGTALGGSTDKQTNGYCRSVEITGGTIVTGILGGEGPGWIGGWKTVGLTGSETTWVYISGGNVYGKIFQADARRDKSGDVRVYCNPVSLKTYGLSSGYSKYVPVEDLTVDGAAEAAGYGLQDVYTIPADNGNDPVLYLWLPAEASLSSVTLKEPFLEYGLGMKKEDVREFRGVTKPKEGGTLYPGFWFLFDDNYNVMDTSVSSARAYIGGVKAEDGSFHPETHTCADGSVITPMGYAVDRERQHLLLNADGSFAKGCAAEEAVWTDTGGRLLLAASDTSKSAPRDMQNRYTYGIRLYAVWDQYEMILDPNRPRGASTQISGTTPAEVHGYDENITIPECGYQLPGYKFTGWTLTADPGEGDQIFRPGDQAEGTALDPAQSGEVTLYAQWEPLSYDIIFDPGESGQEEFNVSAVFDESVTLPGEERLQQYPGHLFRGWAGAGFGTFYEGGSSVCNLCELDENGVPIGRKLTAVWIGEGCITITVTKDRRPVSGLGEKILVKGGGAEFRLPWGYKEGNYILDPSMGAGLPGGTTYSIIIEDWDYPIPEGSGFAYDGSESVSVSLNYYTVQADRENENVSGVGVSYGGAQRTGETVVSADTELSLSAEVKKGYHFTGYTVHPPVLDGYTEGGAPPVWESDPTAKDQKIIVKGPVRLTAHADPNVYTVHFDANGGSGEMEDQPMVYDTPRRLEAGGFTRKGYIFRGWNTSKDPAAGTGFDDRAMIDENNQDELAPDEDGGTATLYALWEPIVYGIDYDLGVGALPEGRNNPVTYTVEDSFSLVNPEAGDYAFTGWTGTGLDKPAVKVTIGKGSAGDRSYKANWKLKEFRVTFETGGGSRVADQTVTIHKSASRPADPTKAGYTFAGWFADKALTKPFDFGREIVSDTTVRAKWNKIPVYTVTFVTGGGSKVPAQNVRKGLKAKQPQDPKRSGYTFAGWYSDKSLTKKFDFSRKITEDTVIYAKWNKVQVYKVTFVTGGGSKVPAQNVRKGMKAKQPQDPKRSGYTFAGWYAEKSLTTRFDFGRTLTGDAIVYAKWTPNPVPVLMAQGKPVGRRSVRTTWTRIPGASEYLVYAAKCGSGLKRVQVTSKNSFRVKRIRGKKLAAHRAYIFRVAALDKNGKLIAVSRKFHVITAGTMGNNANIRTITAKKKVVTLKKGQTAALGAEYTLPKGKKHLNRKHGAYLRFTSDNPKVAAVTKNGRVKAGASGKAVVYIQDTSGKYCTTVIIVK